MVAVGRSRRERQKEKARLADGFNIGNLSYGEVKLLPLVRLTQVDAESAPQQILYALLRA